jgi:hypothetical protein
MQVNVEQLKTLLSGIHLGGIVNECVFSYDHEGRSFISCLDTTNSIFISGEKKVGLVAEVPKDAEVKLAIESIGIGDIGLMLKSLNVITGDTADITIKDNKLNIKFITGVFKYLLSDPAIITTVLKTTGDESPIDKLVKLAINSVELTEQCITLFKSNYGIISPEMVTINVTKAGVITITGGEETEHQFTIDIGIVKTDIPPGGLKEFSCKVVGSQLIAILGQLNFKHKVLPTLSISQNSPLVFGNTDFTWVLATQV